MRDPAARIIADLLRQYVEFGLRRIRAEHDPVTARSLNWFDDELVDAVENLFALVRKPAPQGVDVLERRLLAQVVLDDLGHIGVDEFVVTDAVAHRTRDDHVAGAGGVEQAGHPQHRVRAELHRVEEVVVDAAIDDIDPLLTLGGAHVHDVVAAEQVTALDEFDAHQPSQQRMFEVRRIGHARSENHDVGVGLVERRRRPQRAQQMARIVADRPHPVRGEQVRKHPRHGAPVLDHIRHTRRRAQVVLQHPELAVLVANEVDTGDVDANPVGRADICRLPVKVLTRVDKSFGQHPIAQDLLRAVHIIEEQFERLHTLGDAALEFGPFGCRDDARQNVEWERPFLSRQRERHALVDECPSESIDPGVEVFATGFCQRLEDAAVCRAYLTAGVEHLVVGLSERRRAGVAAEERALDLAWLGGRGLRAFGRSSGFCCLGRGCCGLGLGSLGGGTLGGLRCRRGTHNLTWCYKNPNSAGLLSD